jgi:hypothetical protein
MCIRRSVSNEEIHRRVVTLVLSMSFNIELPAPYGQYDQFEEFLDPHHIIAPGLDILSQSRNNKIRHLIMGQASSAS